MGVIVKQGDAYKLPIALSMDGGNTLIDLTADTVTAANMLSGTTAHGKDGAAITGTLTVQNFHVVNAKPTADSSTEGDLFFVVG